MYRLQFCINKMDLLREKIQKGTINMKDKFPEFHGDPGKIDDVQEFIGSMFDVLCKYGSQEGPYCVP